MHLSRSLQHEKETAYDCGSTACVQSHLCLIHSLVCFPTAIRYLCPSLWLHDGHVYVFQDRKSGQGFEAHELHWDSYGVADAQGTSEGAA